MYKSLNMNQSLRVNRVSGDAIKISTTNERKRHFAFFMADDDTVNSVEIYTKYGIQSEWTLV